MKYEETIGQIYGLCRVEQVLKIGHRYWADAVCVQCGRSKRMHASELFNNKYTSCLCQNVIHSDYKSRLYKIWANMKYRCSNPNAQEYYNYGGKGVRVCDEWTKYENFRNWAFKNGYQDNLTIDRIDSNKGYNPDNCRWLTKSDNTREANKGKQHRRADGGTYYGINASQTEFYVFNNANRFAKTHGLYPGCVRQCAAGEKKTHYGWTFGYLKDLVPKPQSTIENTEQSGSE